TILLPATLPPIEIQKCPGPNTPPQVRLPRRAIKSCKVSVPRSSGSLFIKSGNAAISIADLPVPDILCSDWYISLITIRKCLKTCKSFLTMTYDRYVLLSWCYYHRITVQYSLSKHGI